MPFNSAGTSPRQLRIFTAIKESREGSKCNTFYVAKNNKIVKTCACVT
jgi:hypothetical protein